MKVVIFGEIMLRLKTPENLRHHQQVWVDINQIV